ncbi:DegT/DnrJ/EryC1/StrS aminotransferase family protein [Saccharopolyspora sp. NPDC000995]
MINLHQPILGTEELDAIAEVFASNWIGLGPRTRTFEAEFAHHLGVDPEQVVFLNSGTAALFLTVQVLDLGPGDDVVLPSISFVAAANAIASSGARPVFCDVDPRTLNPTLDDVAKAITPATKAVLLLHYGGSPGEVTAITDFCREKGLVLIEDTACAVASSVHGTSCGTFGDLATWSFDAMKILVTGDGGMFYAADPELAHRARRLAYHGLEQMSGFDSAKSSNRWWDIRVEDIGQRLIGNDMTAVLGSVQLRKLPEFISRRREIATQYDRLLSDVPGVLLPPTLPDGHVSSHYFYWVQLAPEIRDQVAQQMLERGIYTSYRYPPLHKVPIYRADCELPSAEQACRRTLLLPLHPSLDDAEVRTVADEFQKAVEHHISQISPLRK